MGYTFIFLLGWIIGLLTGLTERLSDKIKKNRKGGIEMSFGSRIKGEVSICCNDQVWREPKISGYKPYCDKCKKRCEIKEIQIKGVTYSVGNVVALIGYNEGKGYTAVMRIDKFHQGGGHIGEYRGGEKIYTANAHYIRSLATDDEIIAEMERRKREKLSGVL